MKILTKPPRGKPRGILKLKLTLFALVILTGYMPIRAYCSAPPLIVESPPLPNNTETIERLLEEISRNPRNAPKIGPYGSGNLARFLTRLGVLAASVAWWHSEMSSESLDRMEIEFENYIQEQFPDEPVPDTNQLFENELQMLEQYWESQSPSELPLKDSEVATENTTPTMNFGNESNGDDDILRPPEIEEIVRIFKELEEQGILQRVKDGDSEAIRQARAALEKLSPEARRIANLALDRLIPWDNPVPTEDEIDALLQTQSLLRDVGDPDARGAREEVLNFSRSASRETIRDVVRDETLIDYILESIGENPQD